MKVVDDAMIDCFQLVVFAVQLRKVGKSFSFVPMNYLLMHSIKHNHSVS